MLAEELGLPIEGPHKDDLFWIEQLDSDGARYGMTAQSFTPDRWLENGDTVTLGELTLDVIHCPGHTPGHVVFFHAPSRFAVVGDVLFIAVIEWQNRRADSLAGLMSLARNQQHVARLQFTNRPGNRFRPVANLHCAGARRQDGPTYGGWLLAPRIIVRHHDDIS